MARPPAPSAERLLAAAAGYLDAARYLAERVSRDGLELWPAAFVNIGFACELALKAAILRLGGTEAELRALGHDLVAALACARGRGLTAAHGGFDKLVGTLGPPFKDMSLRYALGEEIELLHLNDAYAIARELIVRCGRLIRPEFAPNIALELN